MPRLSALLVLPKGSATLPLEWPALKKCSLLLHKHTRGRSDPLFAAPRLKVRGIRVFAAAQHIHELAAGLGANHAYGILHGGKRVRSTNGGDRSPKYQDLFLRDAAQLSANGFCLALLGW